MINSIFEAFQYPFFIYALIIIVLLSIVFPLYGNIVILRKEANVAHAFAHIGLLGIAFGLRFQRPVEWCVLGSVILTIFLLRVLSAQDKYSFDAIHEIVAQLGLVGAILIVSQMSGYKADISAYLFGDILLVRAQDLWVLVGIVMGALGVYFGFHKQWYAHSLSPEIALSKNYTSKNTSLWYMILLGILVASAMKIVGVLLVTAFLVLPSNISKLFAKNKKQRVFASILIALFSGLFALFLSWFVNLPTGACIVAVLLGVYFVGQTITIVRKKCHK